VAGTDANSSLQRVPLSEEQRRGRAFMSVYGLLVALATLAFIGLIVFVRDEDSIKNFDAPIARAIQGVPWPAGGWLLTHTSDLGWFPNDAASVTVIAVLLFLLRLRLESIVIVVSTLLAGEAGTIVKDLVQRARPSATFVHLTARLADYSFPSGHVIFATVLFGTTFWVVWITWRSSWARNAVLIVLVLPIVLMGPSRVYLGEHWPTDVIGAYCLAGLWVTGSVELILVLKPRLNSWWRGRPHRRGRRSPA
jgi:membrane-associated phospholipid phosphatase